MLAVRWRGPPCGVLPVYKALGQGRKSTRRCAVYNGKCAFDAVFDAFVRIFIAQRHCGGAAASANIGAYEKSFGLCNSALRAAETDAEAGAEKRRAGRCQDRVRYLGAFVRQGGGAKACRAHRGVLSHQPPLRQKPHVRHTGRPPRGRLCGDGQRRCAYPKRRRCGKQAK